MRILTLLLLISSFLLSFEIEKSSRISSQNQKAANELKSYLEKIFPYSFKVNKSADATIFLVYDSSLKDDEFILKSTKKTLYIKAKNDRGLFYGIYYFLQRYLGVKFLTKDVEIIPKKKSLKLGNFTLKKSPFFAYREVFSGASEDIGFATKLFLNGRLGHRVWHESKNYPKLRKIYNEFSSGELIGEEFECNGQYEFANIDAKKTALENLKKKISKLDIKYDDYIYIQHEDRGSICEDRFDFLDYVIYIANSLDKNVLFEAYEWSAIPPKKDKKLPKNLSIFFSTIEANFAKAITEKENQSIYKNLKKWGEFKKDILIWHYIANFDGYLQPTPNIFSTAKNIQIFSNMKNVKGIFLQGAYESGAGELDELKTWVFSKLLWDPKQDVDLLIKQFCDAYYKDSSIYVQKYIKALDLLSKKLDNRLFVKTSVDLKYFDKKYLRYLETILDKATKAASDKEVKKRVLKLYSGIDYVAVIKGFASTKAKKRFKNFLETFDVKNYAEGRSIDGLFEILKIDRKVSKTPKMLKGLKKGKDWFEFQEYALRLCCTKYAKDPKSSDGVSVYMNGDQEDWGFQLDILNLPRGKWDVYASVRVVKNGSISSNLLPAIHYGVDPSSKGLVFSAQLKNDEYQDIKIATIDTKKSSDDYIWLSPSGNGSIKRLYVDRFFIVRAK